jgi:EAL domain-containing protein (putative c-di-GMP-specific phosphodiesterase class I)
MNLDKRELGTVLAALRHWQNGGIGAPDGFSDIATEDGEMEPLSVHEVDTLCERLNGPGDMRPFFFDAALNNAKAAAQMCAAKLQDANGYADPVAHLLLLQLIETAKYLESAVGLVLDATRSES